MMTSFTVACVQTNSGPDVEDNLRDLGPMLNDAVERGASLIAFPEMVGAMITGGENALGAARTEHDHPALAWFRDKAVSTGRFILVGSLAVSVEEGRRLANRSYLIGPDGHILATYDKIHMFDVDLEGGESYRESAVYRPGSQAVLASTPFGTIGLTVCYDVRFPGLYRHLAKAGARIITVPAAFTVPTGQAHWLTLIRSRAIETGCFVVAPAQCGEHHKGRKTFGHSLIVDPWGRVLAEAGTSPEVIVAELDMTAVDRVRAMVPSLNGDVDFSGVVPEEGN